MNRALLVLSALATSCAGVTARVTYDDLKYPVSMSGALPDNEGNLHVLGHDLEDAGALRARWTAFGIGYGTQTKELRVGKTLNAQIERLQGQGVVQLELESSPCPLDYFFPLTILPFWPGCTTISARGRVVRWRGAADVVVDTPAPPPEPQPAPPAPAPVQPTKRGKKA